MASGKGGRTSTSVSEGEEVRVIPSVKGVPDSASAQLISFANRQ